MSLLHIANTDLEFELTDSLPLNEGLRRNPIVHQLQFLPLLYRNEGDGVGVTDLPSSGPACQLLSDSSLPYDQIESWGPSKAIADWAKKRGLLYEMPPWEVVKQVNSKAFSFAQTPPLPQAELLYAWNDLERWMGAVEGPKVLKSCFGLSGQGHLLLPAAEEKIRQFTEKEFQAERPVIAEPWVTRRLDFSTQWVLRKQGEIEYVGSPVLQSDSLGRYAGNLIGEEEKIFGHYLPKLNQHKEIAQVVLKKMASLGFFGNVGFDSLIWGEDILHAVVEINARKTMGWVALQIRKRLFPNQTIQVSYGSANHSAPLLPQGVIKPNGEVMKFRRNLFAERLA